MTQGLQNSIRVLLMSLVTSGCGGPSYVPTSIAANPPSPTVARHESPAAALAVEPQTGTEQYAEIAEHGFHSVREEPLSTFSVDVDTAAYSNVRRFLTQGQRPPADAVRVEELINYFDYDYPAPRGEHPIAISTELASSPFHRQRELLRVALSARDTDDARGRPARNLVFLLDVSGSMQDSNKLPLVKESIGMLVSQLDERDSVSIAVYAGASGVALPPTRASDKARIMRAVHELQAGGSTHGSAGLELAYELALQRLQPGAINRVILATDGDFNVGVTSHGGLLGLIERRRQQGVSLTVLGFGMGNLKDATMELLADHGNGNYAYIDTLNEAQKVLVDEIGATLHTVAQDAKLQLTWNAEQVASYRLIGYENRKLRDEDFANDRKDAGDLGDGHHVTALYEIERTGEARRSAEPLVRVDVRYKRPGDSESVLLTHEAQGEASRFESASEDMRFASAVAGFGMLLRESPHSGAVRFADALRIARGAMGRDPYGYRRELVELVASAQELYED
jgi:Ca-activated chloride channel family protein